MSEPVTDATTTPAPTTPVEPAAAAPDPMAILRTRSYVQLLVLAALIGVPVSGIAYGYLKLVALLQNWIFTDLPKQIGFAGTPAWW